VPPLSVAVATVLLLLIATEATVGAVVQFPPIVNLPVVKLVIASLKVATIDVGVVVTYPVFGVTLDRVGAVLSMVICELSADTLD
jgi:hypothetical protein